MSNQVTNSADHDEIIAMLPWFVNQTLEASESKALSSHIKNCKECQIEVQFLQSLNDTVRNDARNSHSLHADVDKNLASVMNRIDEESQQGKTMSSGMSWLKNQLDNVFNFLPTLSFPQWSATALAGVLVAVLGIQMFSDQSEDRYSVLSSPDVANPSMRMSVEVSGAVSEQMGRSIIAQGVEALEQNVQIEATADGVYTLVFDDSVGVTELSKLMNELANESQIERVEILP